MSETDKTGVDPTDSDQPRQPSQEQAEGPDTGELEEGLQPRVHAQDPAEGADDESAE
jgi:hypothetical protein